MTPDLGSVPQGGLFLFLAAALLLAGLPQTLAALCAASRDEPARHAARDLYVCALIAAGAFFPLGSWLYFGADALGVFGLPPGPLPVLGQTDSRGFAAAAFFLYHFGLALLPFGLFYLAAGERLTLAGNAVICLVLCGLAYPVFGHIALGSRWLGAAGAGWLAERGFYDAGGGASAVLLGLGAALAGLLLDSPPAPASPRPAPRARLTLLGVFAAQACLAAGATDTGLLSALAKMLVAGACGVAAARIVALAREPGGANALDARLKAMRLSDWLGPFFWPQEPDARAGEAASPATASLTEEELCPGEDDGNNEDIASGTGRSRRFCLDELTAPLSAAGEPVVLNDEKNAPGALDGLAASLAAMSVGLTASAWWATPLIGAVSGALARTGLDRLGPWLSLSLQARLVIALGVGAAVGAPLAGLFAYPQPLPGQELVVSGGFSLAFVELTGVALALCFGLVSVWLTLAGLKKLKDRLARAGSAR